MLLGYVAGRRDQLRWRWRIQTHRGPQRRNKPARMKSYSTQSCTDFGGSVDVWEPRVWYGSEMVSERVVDEGSCPVGVLLLLGLQATTRIASPCPTAMRPVTAWSPGPSPARGNRVDYLPAVVAQVPAATLLPKLARSRLTQRAGSGSSGMSGRLSGVGRPIVTREPMSSTVHLRPVGEWIWRWGEVPNALLGTGFPRPVAEAW